jgi:hypothetical protein
MSNDDAPSGGADGGDDELMPKLRRQELSDEVRRRRDDQAEHDEMDRQVYEERIEAHLAAHRIALDFLEQSHQWVADNTDLDLVGNARPAASCRWPAAASASVG